MACLIMCTKCRMRKCIEEDQSLCTTESKEEDLKKGRERSWTEIFFVLTMALSIIPPVFDIKAGWAANGASGKVDNEFMLISRVYNYLYELDRSRNCIETRDDSNSNALSRIS